MKRFRRYQAAELARHDFYQMPKWLKKEKISNDAKILYIYTLDRYRLSMKNGWVDSKGEVFCYYTREMMEEDLNLTTKTLIRKIDELVELGIWTEVRQGLGKPNRIYISTLSDEAMEEYRKEGQNDSSRDGDFPDSRPVNITSLDREECTSTDLEKFHPNKMSISKNNMSKNKREKETLSLELEKVELVTSEDISRADLEAAYELQKELEDIIPAPSSQDMLDLVEIARAADRETILEAKAVTGKKDLHPRGRWNYFKGVLKNLILDKEHRSEEAEGHMGYTMQEADIGAMLSENRREE